jgi:leucine dehydrogenase
MLDLIRSWDGEHVIVRFDRTSGTWIFIAIHSTRLGPGTGGTRLRTYSEPAGGLADAMRLAAAMTVKFAVIGLPAGGGKAVLAVPGPLDRQARRGLLERYGDMVTALRGAFNTGPDMGTSATDMDVIGARCPYVFGKTEAAGGAGSSGPSTARGVLYGIEASCAHVFGDASLAGRSVVVQGAGSVGRPLVHLLHERGARVVVSDVDRAAVDALRAELEVESVDPDATLITACDVFAPCAIGGVLSERTIPFLRCQIVAGGANNPLASSDDAERLRDAGILYAPDFVINAGAAIYLEGCERFHWPDDEIDRRLRGIGETLTEIYERAAEAKATTLAAAEALARERLTAAAPTPTA